MSYILEAIRRADRERKLGQAPQADQLSQTETQVEKRPPWFWLACLNVIAIALFIAWFVTRSAGTGPAAERVAAESFAEEPTEISNVVQEEVVATWDDPYIPPYEAEAEAVQVVESVPPEPAATAVLHKEPTEPPQAPANSPSIERSVVPDAAPEARATSASRADPVSTTSAAAVAPPLTNNDIETGPTTEPATESLPTLKDLPIETRKRLPDLQVNTHFYSENARRRFVILNLEKYREGDQLNEGPDVVEIRSDGIVLDYQGERFLLPR